MTVLRGKAARAALPEEWWGDRALPAVRLLRVGQVCLRVNQICLRVEWICLRVN